MPRGGRFGRGYGFFGRVGWFGGGRGLGNPYPLCRWFPWLPRRWWAYPAFNLPYYGVPWSMPYVGYCRFPYAWPYGYSPYPPYY